MQNEVTEMESSAHVKDIASKIDATSTAEAEDVGAAHPEASARLAEADAIVTRMGIASTQEERVKRAQKVTKKRPASQTCHKEAASFSNMMGGSKRNCD